MAALLTKKFVALFAVVALLLASSSVGAPESGANGTVDEKDFKPTGAINMAFDLARGSYPGLQRQLHQVLATSRRVDGIPVLVAQTLPRDPPTWILIAVSSGTAKITGSVRLPLTEDYRELVKGHKKLEGLDVGKEALVQALAFLSTYKKAKDKVEEDTLGISLARLIVVISEAARFKSFYDTAVEGLKDDHALVTGNEAKLVVLWGTISSKLIAGGEWEETTELKEAGVASKQDAINSVSLLLLPKGMKVQRLAGNATFN